VSSWAADFLEKSADGGEGKGFVVGGGGELLERHIHKKKKKKMAREVGSPLGGEKEGSPLNASRIEKCLIARSTRSTEKKGNGLVKAKKTRCLRRKSSSAGGKLSLFLGKKSSISWV